MPVYKNAGMIPRIIMTVGGEYIRLAPGAISANVEIDLKNPVIAAYLAKGDITEIKPKATKKGI